MSLSLNSEFVMCSANCYSSLRQHCLLSCKMCTFMFVCLSKFIGSHELMMESAQPSSALPSVEAKLYLLCQIHSLVF